MPNPLQRASDIHLEDERRRQDFHQKEREVLFENETLVVKVLQAVSGSAMIGALSQTEALINLIGLFSFRVFLTSMGLALIVAVFSVHWKHQYKMWDVKTAATNDENERKLREKLTNHYLKALRLGMWFSLLIFAGGFTQLILHLRPSP